MPNDLDDFLNMSLDIDDKEKENIPEKNVEKKTRDFISEVENSFIKRAKTEKERFDLATDSEYWVCLCFQSREQVEAFIEKSGWGEKTDKYIDGQEVASRLNISLPQCPEFGKIRINKSFSEIPSIEI